MAIYSKKQLTEQAEIIAVITALRGVTVLKLVQTYSVLKYTSEILDRIGEVLVHAFKLIPKRTAAEGRHKQKIGFEKKPQIDKIVRIFVSSNQEHYGDLIRSIGDLFLKDFKFGNSDGIVIGKIGRIFLEQAKLKITDKIYYFDLDDDRPDIAQINKILATAMQYRQVIIYYGIAQTALNQVATKTEALISLSDIYKPTTKYFYEPNAGEVLNFLQDHINMYAIHQRLFQAQYGKLSARRWNWTKQQLTRSRLLEELTAEYKEYRKELIQKQQQVNISSQMTEGQEWLKIR